MLIFNLVLGWVLFAFVLGFLFYPKTYAWLYESNEKGIGENVAPILSRHFGNVPANELFIISREFPKRVHVELHRELEKIFGSRNLLRANGLDTEFYNMAHRESAYLPVND